MTTYLLNRRICNINNRKNIRLELYSTCISVLKNFGVFFRPPPKLPNFVKFGRNFAEILNPESECLHAACFPGSATYPTKTGCTGILEARLRGCCRQARGTEGLGCCRGQEGWCPQAGCTRGRENQAMTGWPATPGWSR